MLCLTRRIDERIVIGDDIVITVLGIRGDRVRLGIEAPRGLPVRRKEIYERKRRDGASPTPPAASRD